MKCFFTLSHNEILTRNHRQTELKSYSLIFSLNEYIISFIMEGELARRQSGAGKQPNSEISKPDGLMIPEKITPEGLRLFLEFRRHRAKLALIRAIEDEVENKRGTEDPLGQLTEIVRSDSWEGWKTNLFESMILRFLL